MALSSTSYLVSGGNMPELDLEAVVITLVIGSVIIGGVAAIYYALEGRSKRKK